MAGLLLACATDDSTGPNRGGTFRPAFAQGQSYGGVVPVGDQYLLNGQAALPSYTNTTLVKITVSGVTKEIWNSVPDGINPPPSPGDINKTYNVYGSLISGGCYYGVKLTYNQVNNWPPPGCNNTGGSSVDTTVSWYLSVRGGGSALRTGRYSNPLWNGQPYYRYEGDLPISVEWVAAEAELTASKRSITASQSVTFTASVSPANAGGVPMPFSVVKWRWKPDNGPEQYPCGPFLQCSHAPTKSGTMFVDLLVNGVPETQSVHVDVYSCLTGDSLLDDPAVRQGVREVWGGSGAGGPDSLRRERYGAVHCSGSECVFQLYPFNPATDDACGAEVVPEAQDGEVLIHDHPFRPRTEFTNGTSCSQGSFRPDDRPSDTDFLNLAGPRILIVIDRLDVYVVPRTVDGLPPSPGPNGNYSGAFTTRRWAGQGACDVTAPPIT